MILNFVYCFQSEWIKKKRSLASWLVVFGAWFTPVIIIIANLIHFNRLRQANLSPSFWQDLWRSSWESMSIFLLPIGAILATSLITQLEFKNNTWKQLHTIPQKFTTIFLAKLAVIMVMMIQFLILFNIGIYLSGMLPGLFFSGVPWPKASIPYGYFLREDIYYFIDILPIIAFQYLISLQFKNFLVPVGGGIALWILAIAVLSWQYGYLDPYAYCGIHYLACSGRIKPPVNINVLSIVYFLIFIIASYILYITKKEKG